MSDDELPSPAPDIPAANQFVLVLVADGVVTDGHASSERENE